jgi:hypothetical protein
MVLMSSQVKKSGEWQLRDKKHQYNIQYVISLREF